MPVTLTRQTDETGQVELELSLLERSTKSDMDLTSSYSEDDEGDVAIPPQPQSKTPAMSQDLLEAYSTLLQGLTALASSVDSLTAAFTSSTSTLLGKVAELKDYKQRPASSTMSNSSYAIRSKPSASTSSDRNSHQESDSRHYNHHDRSKSDSSSLHDQGHHGRSSQKTSERDHPKSTITSCERTKGANKPSIPQQKAPLSYPRGGQLHQAPYLKAA